jgi:uric acid-xanthine permease
MTASLSDSSVVGTSFATIPVATGAFAQWYANGTCPVDSSGAHLPCPEGYGAVLGTACACALLEIGLSFMPPKALKKAFPPLVTGPVVLLIGVNLVGTGYFLIYSLVNDSFKDWAGGNGNCYGRPTSGDFMLCPSNTGKHALPWGSAEFIGLGFSVWISIVIIERFGSPLMKSCAVVLGLIVGIIISAACGYFDNSPINAAPAATFIWVKTFKLTVSGPIVLPFLAVFLILMMEAIGDITATCDVSR